MLVIEIISSKRPLAIDSEKPFYLRYETNAYDDIKEYDPSKIVNEIAISLFDHSQLEWDKTELTATLPNGKILKKPKDSKTPYLT